MGLEEALVAKPMLLSPRRSSSPTKGTAAFMSSGRTRDPSTVPTAGVHVAPYDYDDTILRLSTPQAASFDKSAVRVPSDVVQMDQGGYRTSKESTQAGFRKHVKSVRPTATESQPPKSLLVMNN
jgi:hypothetical protein